MRNAFSSNPIFKLRGGIGNQLFIYSAGIFLSGESCKIPIYDPTGIDHDECISEIGLPGTFLSPLEVRLLNLMRLSPASIWSKNYLDFTFEIGFSESTINIPRKSHVSGYFQNSLYAEFCLNRGFFKNLQAQPDTQFLLDKYNEIQSNHGSILHLRFGDFLKAKETLGNLSANYYSRAIKSKEEISQNPIYVMSDDNALAKKYLQDFKGLNLQFLDHFSEYKSFQLLPLFGAAKQIICANSTFSWWGAFLSGNARSIIVPSPWFKSPELQSQLSESFYPSHFQRMKSVWIS